MSGGFRLLVQTFTASLCGWQASTNPLPQTASAASLCVAAALAGRKRIAIPGKKGKEAAASSLLSDRALGKRRRAEAAKQRRCKEKPRAWRGLN